MPDETDEPVLPYTPSNTSRKSRVGYLGLVGIGFNGLWPLFGGLVASVALALHSFLGDGFGSGHSLGKTILSALPASVGFFYLRFLVAGRPPHFKGDLWATALGLRVDFSDPPLRLLAILPRISLDAGVAAGPARASDLRHPMQSSDGTRRRV